MDDQCLQQPCVKRHLPFLAVVSRPAVLDIAHLQHSAPTVGINPDEIRDSHAVHAGQPAILLVQSGRHDQNRLGQCKRFSRVRRDVTYPVLQKRQRHLRPISEGTHPPGRIGFLHNNQFIHLISHTVQRPRLVPPPRLHPQRRHLRLRLLPSGRPMLGGQELQAQPPLALPVPGIPPHHRPRQRPRPVARGRLECKPICLSIHAPPLLLPRQQRRCIRRRIQPHRPLLFRLLRLPIQDREVTGHHVRRSGRILPKGIRNPLVKQKRRHLLDQQIIRQRRAKRVQREQRAQRLQMLRRPPANPFPVHRQIQRLKIHPVRAIHTHLVRRGRQILHAGAQYVFDAPLQHQISNRPQIGPVAIETARGASDLNPVVQHHRPSGPRLRGSQQTAGAGEQPRCLVVDRRLNHLPDALRHLVRNPKPGAQPEQLLLVQPVGRPRRHPALFPGLDLDHLQPFPRQLHPVPRVQLPHNRPGQIRNRLPGKLQDIILLGRREVAPDAPFQKIIPVAPAAPVKAARPFSPQPALLRHRLKNPLQRLLLRREQILKRPQGNPLLLVQTGQHLLRQHAGIIPGLQALHNPRPRQAQQPQKPQRLRLRPLSPADPPKVRAPLPAVGPANALQKCRCRIRRFVKHHPVHIANVNPQLQRARGNTQRVPPPPEPSLRAPPRFGFQIGIMQLGHAPETPLPVQNRKQPVARAPAVGKHQHLSVAPCLIQIVQQRHQLLLVVPQLHQVRHNPPLNRFNQPNRILPQPEKPDDRIHIRNRGRQRDLLHRPRRPPLQAFQQIRQLLPPVVIKQRVHLIDHHRRHPLRKPPHRRVRAAQHHVQRLRRGQHHIRTRPPGPLEIPGPHANPHPQALVQDHPQPPLQIHRQRPCGHHVNHGLLTPGLNHALQTRRQHRLRLAGPGCRLQHQIPAFQQGCDRLFLNRIKVGKRTVERPVGVGKGKQRGGSHAIGLMAWVI